MNITSEYLIRNFNLYLLSDIKMNRYTIEICNWADDILKDIKKFRTDEKNFQHSIIYGKNESKLYIEYDTISNYLLVDKGNFYKDFNECFIYDMFDVREFISVYIANMLKTKDYIYHNKLTWVDSVGKYYTGGNKIHKMMLIEINT